MQTTNNYKEIIDKFLVLNVFIIILGGLLFLVSITVGMYNINAPLKLFQLLWTPLFVPSISLFFTAVLIQAVVSRFSTPED